MERLEVTPSPPLVDQEDSWCYGCRGRGLPLQFRMSRKSPDGVGMRLGLGAVVFARRWRSERGIDLGPPCCLSCSGGGVQSHVQNADTSPVWTGLPSRCMGLYMARWCCTSRRLLENTCFPVYVSLDRSNCSTSVHVTSGDLE